MALSPQELEAAYEQYGHLVLRRCRAVLRNDSMADDALQETFIRLYRYGDAFRQVEAPVRWLYRVAERVCFDFLKRRGDTPAMEADVADEAPSPVDHAEQLSCRDAVLRFLGRLDEKTRQVALLHFLDGLSQEEIAQEVGWSRQTVNKKLMLVKARALAWRKALGVE